MSGQRVKCQRVRRHRDVGCIAHRSGASMGCYRRRLCAPCTRQASWTPASTSAMPAIWTGPSGSASTSHASAAAETGATSSDNDTNAAGRCSESPHDQPLPACVRQDSETDHQEQVVAPSTTPAAASAARVPGRIWGWLVTGVSQSRSLDAWVSCATGCGSLDRRTRQRFGACRRPEPGIDYPDHQGSR